ncbi:MAG: DUF1499 domain-containing protein [Synechococcales bacterium]|nr:DUF1499 domain-containing protein [Synechococcales bacterium]
MLYTAKSLLFTLLFALTVWIGGMPAAIAQPHPSSPADSTPTTVTQTPSGGSSVFSFSGKRPANLGVQEGKLAACPNSPNCVSSQSPTADPKHYTEPLPLTTSPEEAIAQLKTIVEGMERTKIITASDDYLYAEFTSAIMGFVDDVEFYADQEAGVVHVRSASRLGESDLGVNRKRVEALRAQFMKA